MKQKRIKPDHEIRKLALDWLHTPIVELEDNKQNLQLEVDKFYQNC